MLKTLPTFSYPVWNFPCWVSLLSWFIYLNWNFSQNSRPFPRMKLEKKTLFWSFLKKYLEISILQKRSWRRRESSYHTGVSCCSSETQKLCFKDFKQYFLKRKISAILGKSLFKKKKYQFLLQISIPQQRLHGKGVHVCASQLTPLNWAHSIQDYVVGAGLLGFFLLHTLMFEIHTYLRYILALKGRGRSTTHLCF